MRKKIYHLSNLLPTWLKLDDNLLMNNKENGNLNAPKKPNWTKPKKISNQHEEIIQMAVIGRSNAYIAKALDFSPQHVARLINSSEISERIKAERETRVNAIIREKIYGLSGAAIDSISQILTSQDARDSTRLEASKWVLEQTVGKAKGIEGPQTTNLVQIIQMIENIPRNLEPKLKDEWDVKMDQVLDEVIPKGLIVGKRTP